MKTVNHITKQVVDYGDFSVLIAKTNNIGEEQQYDEKHIPVSHHLAKIKQATGKPAYCLFLAPNINDACVAHFYALHQMNISYYGGTSEILPLPISIFRKMVEDSYKAEYTPNPNHVRQFFEWSKECAKNSTNERDWFTKVQDRACQWLN